MPTALPLHRRAFVIGLALLAPVAAGAGNDAEPLRSILDAVVRPLMAQHHIPGMAVGLTVDGGSHVFNFGVLSMQSQAPVTEATIFEIGSISKMFTTGGRDAGLVSP